MIFVGDVHGKTGPYIHLLRTLPEGPKVFQLGDMGLGFKGVGLPPPGSNMPNRWNRFIRGNHDSPAKCAANPYYAGDYGYDAEESLFWCGGAWSIDAKWRIEGISWWKDEEQSPENLQKAFELYVQSKPRIVATHEAPTYAAITMLDGLMNPLRTGPAATDADLSKGEDYQYYKAKTGCVNTRTNQILQQMFDIHRPEHWVFGHYHVTRDFDFKGCKFQCLAELQWKEIKLDPQ